jgi:toxin ParE1/3/4
MRREVVLTADAEADLERLYRHLAEHDSKSSAEYVLGRLLEVSESLAQHPERGSVPKELRSLGMTQYRQVFFKPYRLIYRIHAERIVIYLIADGRRDMQTLLAQRMLGARMKGV